ncbi:helix-turn-helix transcriptional regulator [Streptomyces sp. NPDC003077]|uniref:helix-turn-helix transcriptional regulator n=1 Tax=Streptomyces sp. NPDC003077 TaxID=3154443 RepID=UPI00339FCC41
MPVTTHAAPGNRPPFDAGAARRLREALGMTPTHVAYGIWSAYGIQVSPATVAAWELGEESPTERELTALAGALWCAPADLMGAPGTLREHRLARGLGPEELAQRIAMDAAVYERIETTGEWTGTDRQAERLAAALDLPLRALLHLTGRDTRLAALLRDAVTTRWQAYVRPVGKLVPLPKPRLQNVLRDLYDTYQSHMTGTLVWGDGTSATTSRETGQAFLDGILGSFWERVDRL